MLAVTFKRTKIIATIGPASSKPEILEELITSGVNGLRLNFSHGTHEEHQEVITLAREICHRHARPVAIIADLQGPKIRLGSLPADGVPMVRGTQVTFVAKGDYEPGVIPMQYDISKYLKAGERVFLRDGQVEVDVLKVHDGKVEAKVVTPGIVFSNQGMNLPDTDLGGDIMTPKDISDVEFAAKHDADYVALSFVQTAEDITNLRERLEHLKSDMAIIAKIETHAAVDNLEDIIIASDGVMVARGDLAVETRPEAVPGIQRRIIELARLHRKPVIVATQMLESMIQSPVPTRAEVSDVATAVLEGADAVMLSGETATGLFPVGVVRMMKRIIRSTEDENLPLANNNFAAGTPGSGNAISTAAAVLARQLPAKIIIAETSSGQTARNLAALRPSVPIIMVTHHQRVQNQLAIVWGGKSFFQVSPEGASDAVITWLSQAGNITKGDAVVVASGSQVGVEGGTDTVRVRIVQ